MVTTAKSIQLTGIVRHLVNRDLMSQEEAQQAVDKSSKKRMSLVAYLVENKIVSAADVAMVAGEDFGFPVIDISAIEVQPELLKMVGINVIKKHNIIPIWRRDRRLFVATADPTNIQAQDEVKFATGAQVDMIVAQYDKLQTAVESANDALDTSMRDMDGDDDDDFGDLDSVDTMGGPGEEDDQDEVEDAPVVRFVNKMLVDAIKKGASDLHFEPYEKLYRVRFRVDGMLQEISKPPTALSAKIAARIKVMSRLDVSERRVPQDGRIKLKLSKSKAIDFRVSTCPTLFGEKCCLRILDSDTSKLNIDQLGYEDHQKELFLENLFKPYGMFLVTGPTGSGKTVSLYSGINLINKVDVNISTAEDPVEINLAGVNQVQVDERTGMTFPKALKAFLRQDPDIILVGEIRDYETGSIAVKAAQTGHMVMSTLHTNDGPQTLTRIQDMGIPSFAVATSINLITAQRLARRLHSGLRKTMDIPKKALLEYGYTEEDLEDDPEFYEPIEGDEECPSGYKGRVGIYQVMPISEAMRRLIIEGANAVQLAEQSASEGIPDIRRSGLLKALSGVTTLAEINRVTVE